MQICVAVNGQYRKKSVRYLKKSGVSMWAGVVSFG